MTWAFFALAPWLASFALGWAIIACLWPALSRGAWTDRWLLRPAAAWLMGAGAASLPHAAWMLAGVDQPGMDAAIDLLLLALAWAWLAVASRRPPPEAEVDRPPRQAQTDQRQPAWLLWLLLPLLVTGALIGLANQAWRIALTPLGDWDAWTIWNLKARYIVRAPADWPAMIASLDWRTHPDYPLMLPTTVARLWLAGGEGAIGPALLSLSWWAAALALLVGLIARQAGLAVACVAGLTLLASPAFAAAGWSQCADAPLAAFALLTAGCIHEALRSSRPRGMLALAGLAAGLAAWTKNEGLLFLVVASLSLAVTWLAPAVSPGRLKRTRARMYAGFPLAAAWLLGAAGPVALLTAGKLLVAADTDLFHQPREAGLLVLLFDPSRWSAILSEAGGQLWRGPGAGVILGLALLAVVSARRPPRRVLRGLLPVALTLALALAGYLAVYLITPHPLDWHLFTSAHRLFAQVWPLALWVTFIALYGRSRFSSPAPTPRAASAPRRSTHVLTTP